MTKRKAMYKVQFFDVTTHVLTDERIVCFEATKLGFKRAVDWALSASEPTEYVGTIMRETVEKP